MGEQDLNNSKYHSNLVKLEAQYLLYTPTITGRNSGKKIHTRHEKENNFFYMLALTRRKETATPRTP